jgi:CSLREA domain-containing protein
VSFIFYFKDFEFRQGEIPLKNRTIMFLLLAFFIVGLNITTTPVQASEPTFTVGNLNDSGPGSLRQAIMDANSSLGPDTISFGVNGSIMLTSQLPNITAAGGPVTLDAYGQKVIIDGYNSGRIFFVDPLASLSLYYLTITNGTNSKDQYGLNDNDGLGGGVENKGTLMILNSTFSNNEASDGGGAIYNSGTAIIVNSTFFSNYVVPFDLSDNTDGGAIYNDGSASILNSTFSDNTFYGSNIHNAVAGSMTLSNTIVSHTSSFYIIDNCSGTITNGGNNIDSGASCGWGSANGSMSNTDPMLFIDLFECGLTYCGNYGGDYGGSTLTLPLKPGSPAINAVIYNAPNGAFPYDQRDIARPKGAYSDIGAYESDRQLGPDFVVNTLADSDEGVCSEAVLGGNCSLREAINAANALAGESNITFSLSGTITLVSTLPSISAAGGALTMDGTGKKVIISGNNSVRVAVVETGALLNLNNLTLANGFVGSLDTKGAGINNSGTLNITNSTFSGNRSWPSGDLNTNGGGGIYNTGTLTISNSTFSANRALNGSGYGGAINNSGGTVEITNSTFSGNSAEAWVGGPSDGFGGALYNGSGTMTLRNSIVTNSTKGGNCAGTITNDGNNIEDGATCGWGAYYGSMSSTNPLLGDLADNGGASSTFALGVGSPAIDGVTFEAPNSAPATDQRGVTRPQGALYDTGAYESAKQPGPTFVVNSLEDSNDGACDIAPGGNCTLREAINAANSLTGANTISFNLDGEIGLLSSLPVISDASGLTIDGTGQDVSIGGGHAVRLLETTASLSLIKLTLANGQSTYGSGVHTTAGTLNITNCSFTGNSSTGLGYGGGVYSEGGSVNIESSTFSGNFAQGMGAGILKVTGALSINNSTFSGNSAEGGLGGGVFFAGDTLTLKNSTFTDNDTTGEGGGVYINSGTAIIANSTFVDNVSPITGGGVYLGGGGGTLEISYSTFYGNSAPEGGSITNQSGAQVILNSSIFANSRGGGKNCYGKEFKDTGNNIDDENSCQLDTGAGSITGNDPMLVALADNGGPTQTMALQPGSPAIDAADDTVCRSTLIKRLDQRSFSRIQGAGCDIGAFESTLQPGPTFEVNSLADSDDGFCDNAPNDCTLREAINAANALAGTTSINFFRTLTGTITLGSTLPNITTGNILAISNSGNPIIISGNHSVRVAIVNTGAQLSLNNLTITEADSASGSGVLVAAGSSLTVSNSTFSDNAADNYGGGILNSGALTISNSTFSGNSSYDGGAILNDGGTATIKNSTLSGNSASHLGGGIYNFSGGPVSLRNTIVANSSSGGNCRGTISNSGNNLDSGTTCGWGSALGSLSSSAPMLGTLADNGGSTQTFALLVGSLAINTGDDTTCAAAPVSGLDQRGVTRPQGVHCDIGAYEKVVFIVFLPMIFR